MERGRLHREDNPLEGLKEGLQEDLRTEPAGSPLIRYLGNWAAEKQAAYLVAVIPESDRRKTVYIAKLEAVRDAHRREENGAEADLYEDAQIQSQPIIDTYKTAAGKSGRMLTETSREAQAATYLRAHLKQINSEKARAKRSAPQSKS